MSAFARRFGWLGLALLWMGVCAATPPVPQRWASDAAGRLSPGTTAALDARLEVFERITRHQVLLWVGPAGDETPETFSVAAFEAWRPGRAGVDDGLVLFLFSDLSRARIEVGYGLEGVLPDLAASEILREQVAPRLAQDDWDGAATAGIDEVLTAIDPQAAAESRDARPPPAIRLTPLEAVLIGLVVVGFLVLLVANPRLALGLLWMFARSSGGSSHTGSGGFRGGGGRSGGGGATG